MILLYLIALVFICSRIAIGFYSACEFEDADDFDKLSKEEKKQFKVHEDSKMILWWVRYYLGRYVNYFWAKPLYSCPICMASVHSVIPVLLFILCFGVNLKWFIVLWPLVALITAGVNKNISVWWDK